MTVEENSPKQRSAIEQARIEILAYLGSINQSPAHKCAASDFSAEDDRSLGECMLGRAREFKLELIITPEQESGVPAFRATWKQEEPSGVIAEGSPDPNREHAILLACQELLRAENGRLL